MVRYVNSRPPKEDFWKLFETTGWNQNYQLTIDELDAALDYSWVCISAYEDDDLVGFGRIVSDKVVHAMIFDLIVVPEFQNRGIGSHILDKLLDICQTENIRDIQLFSAKGKADFYIKRGFEARPTDAPGMQFSRKD
ncbi:GNAT family N-acetyltransferase [Chloroflexota bacterium]